MQLDAHATNLDINTLIDDLCDSTDTSYPVAKKVLNINPGLETIIGRILGADGLWEWDDTNYTDLPVGTTTLVAAQQDYALDNVQLKIERVSILDSDGNYQLLTPISEADIEGDVDEYFETDGLPQYYDKKGRSLFLYPAPAAANVTLALGLKVHFQRGPSLFATTDTTKTPGFASIFHYILAYMAAIPYCLKYHPERVAAYQNKVDQVVGNPSLRITGEIVKFYTKRGKDTRYIITTKKISYI
jgi:hypothetical protein